MAVFTRVNGTAGTRSLNGGLPANSSQSGQSVKLYLITVKDTGATAVSLAGETGVGGALEAVMRVLPSGPLVYSPANNTSGVISVVMDGHSAPAASVIQTAIRSLGSTVGTGGVDVTGTTVADGTVITVS
jgi:hypothetical protein